MSRTPIGRALQPEKASTSKVHSDISPPRSFSFSWFVTYKFLNSLFMGLSIGSVFTLYAPLSPATFSAGGIGLALATLIIATQYHRLFNRDWFFRLSFLVECVILLGVIAVLLLPIDQQLAMFVYLGYQLSFAFGGYLVRYETLLIARDQDLKTLDVAKQIAYLVGMGLAWIIYQTLESYWSVSTADGQIQRLYSLLVVVEIAVLCALARSFPRPEKNGKV